MVRSRQPELPCLFPLLVVSPCFPLTMIIIPGGSLSNSCAEAEAALSAPAPGQQLQCLCRGHYDDGPNVASDSIRVEAAVLMSKNLCSGSEMGLFAFWWEPSPPIFRTSST